jgi:hypothetical protein
VTTKDGASNRLDTMANLVLDATDKLGEAQHLLGQINPAAIDNPEFNQVATDLPMLLGQCEQLAKLLDSTDWSPQT